MADNKPASKNILTPLTPALSRRESGTMGAVLWLMAVAASGRAELPPAVLVDGGRFPAAVTAIDQRGVVALRTRQGTRSVELAQLVSWGAPRETPSRTLIVMADGSVLAADVVDADRVRLQARSSLIESVAIPRPLLSGIVLQPPADRQRADRLLDQVLAGTAGADRLLLANGDEVTGRVERMGPKMIEVEAEVGPMRLPAERLTAVVFGRPAAAIDPGRPVWAGLSDGSRFPALRLERDEHALRITLAGGLTLSARPEELVWLQPLGGRAVYLSDLRPADYRQIPFLDLTWPYRADRNVTGGWLRADGRLWLKGLGMHSTARLTYLLTEKYCRFEASLAIDDQTHGGGSVRFRVFLDGQPKYASPVIRGGQPSLPIAVELGDAKRIDLVVDFAERGDQLDRADWLDARLDK